MLNAVLDSDALPLLMQDAAEANGMDRLKNLDKLVEQTSKNWQMETTADSKASKTCSSKTKEGKLGECWCYTYSFFFKCIQVLFTGG